METLEEYMAGSGVEEEVKEALGVVDLIISLAKGQFDDIVTVLSDSGSRMTSRELLEACRGLVMIGVIGAPIAGMLNKKESDDE